MKEIILKGLVSLLVIVAIACISYAGYWIIRGIGYGINGDFSSGYVCLFMAMAMTVMTMFPLLGALGIGSKIPNPDEDE
jgi:uncharacterized membrane protein